MQNMIMVMWDVRYTFHLCYQQVEAIADTANTIFIMLRHTGQRRSYQHNIRLAILLSLNAGFINASGFLAFTLLTTNVTGHAALLAVYVASANFGSALLVALWLLLFLLGAFISSLYISYVGINNSIAYSTPIFTVALILAGVALFGSRFDHSLFETGVYAGSLLFAMGIQNALVTMLSGSEVRTTHLTGMFTDLGIDLAAMTVSTAADNSVRRRIYLRLSIIFSFLTGGVIGGLIFSKIHFQAFYIPVITLLVTLYYDRSRIKISRIIHNKKNKISKQL
ncbi:MAG: DUF1275 domain-containing protein [Taibaiella sp.]|nr:DUF1275 domain-containing protein [Taibaiella sp.]